MLIVHLFVIASAIIMLTPVSRTRFYDLSSRADQTCFIKHQDAILGGLLVALYSCSRLVHDFPDIQHHVSARTTIHRLIHIAIISKRNREYKVWKDQGIPGPNPWLHVADMLTGSFLTLDLRRVKEFGKIFGIHTGSIASLVVADPVLLKHMLIQNHNSFRDRRRVSVSHPMYENFLIRLSGDEWRRKRSVMTPAFTSAKIKAMTPLIKQSIDSMAEFIDDRIGKEFDCKHLFGCLTLDIIAKTAFAIDINAFTDENNPFLKHARKVFEIPVWRAVTLVLMPKFLRKLFKLNYMDSSSIDYLSSLAYYLMSIRKNKTQDETNEYADFMQLMMHAESLTDEETAAAILIILLGAYETSAALLMHAVHSLACNTDVQERLKCEVDAAPSLDFETLEKEMPYLNAVVNETLRMYPPATRVDRCVSDKNGFDFESPIGKIRMPHGSSVMIPIYAMHHMDEYFPDPEKFDPERFMPENRDKLQPNTFLPFAIGPRDCLGKRFAQLEAKQTLAVLVQKYRFVKSANTDIPLDFSPTIVMLNPARVVVRIEKR